MPRRLLRGIIDFGDNKLSEAHIARNYKALSRSRYEWNHPDERKIFNFIKAFTNEHLEPPSAATIRDFFERVGDNELSVLEKLKDIEAAIVYKSKDYYTLLDNLQDDQSQNQLRVLLKDAEEIAIKGRIIDKEVVKGVRASIQYLSEKAHELIPPDSSAITDGDVTQDAPLEWEAYKLAKVSKANVYGVPTGIDHVDTVCHGIKRGELWVHAAEPGGLKTTFALNWAYNAITRYRANVLYVSLEMKYEHLRKILCAIHTSNGIFKRQGYNSLDYRKIRDGELTPDEEAFYQMALHDLENNPEYCRLKVWAPDKDISVQDIRVYAEQLNKSMDLGLLVIDQDELVKPNKTYRDYIVERNSVMRDLKMMALHYNGGAGVPVVDLHQINRDGMSTAEKGKGKAEAEGRYSMRHLAYANQVERSADYITTSYATKEMKEQGFGIIDNMKNRDNMLFDHTRIGVDMSCHRIRNWDPAATGFGGEVSQDELAQYV